jgi:hypothetical protein
VVWFGGNARVVERVSLSGKAMERASSEEPV